MGSLGRNLATARAVEPELVVGTMARAPVASAISQAELLIASGTLLASGVTWW